MTRALRRLATWLALALTVLPAAAAAQDSPLRPLADGIDARQWAGVGRLEIAGKGFCTAALISDRLVLTAAHCLYDAEGARIDAGRLLFAAGMRDGRSLAERQVSRVALHPRFLPGVTPDRDSFGADIALLELAQPIRGTRVRPYPVAAAPERGANVGVVSYGVDRAETPALQRICSVLETWSSAMIMSCSVDFGSSGAPVFSLVDGSPRIVGVVTAKASVGRRDVSVSAVALDSYETLRSVLNGQGGVRPGPAQVRVLSGGERNAGIGAKFVRP